MDGPVSQTLNALVEMTITLLLRLGAVVAFSPIFVIPGMFISMVGGWCGQVYIKAQLSVKREMSNGRSPVLSHFGAAMAGLGKRPVHFLASDRSRTISVSIRAYGAQNAFKLESLLRIDRYTRAARTFYNLNRYCITSWPPCQCSHATSTAGSAYESMCLVASLLLAWLGT